MAQFVESDGKEKAQGGKNPEDPVHERVRTRHYGGEVPCGKSPGEEEENNDPGRIDIDGDPGDGDHVNLFA